MAIKNATRTGGEFLDLRELAADGPVLCLFRIVEFMPGEPDNYRKTTYPVVADVLICDGPRAGELHPAEEIKFAPAASLRGVTAKASDAGAQPTNDIGEEIAGRVLIIDKPGANPFVGIDPVSATEGKAIEALYDSMGGEALWSGGGKQLANAGASAPAADHSTLRPWK